MHVQSSRLGIQGDQEEDDSQLQPGAFWNVQVLGAQSCQFLCNPMGCRMPGSSAHGVVQARIVQWVAISFSRPS